MSDQGSNAMHGGETCEVNDCASLPEETEWTHTSLARIEALFLFLIRGRA